MSDLIHKIRQAQVRAAEAVVIASIPRELLQRAEGANAEFAAKGGCPGCKSKRIGVHHGFCPELDKDDLY